MQISFTSLSDTNKIQKNVCHKRRIGRLISIKINSKKNRLATNFALALSHWTVFKEVFSGSIFPEVQHFLLL